MDFRVKGTKIRLRSPITRFCEKRGIRPKDRRRLILGGTVLLGHLSFAPPAQIKADGLRPQPVSNWVNNPAYGPRPGHVYLFRENTVLTMARGGYVYLVDWEQLDHKRFAVDEDVYFDPHVWPDSVVKRMQPDLPSQLPDSVRRRLARSTTKGPAHGPTTGEWINNFAAELGSAPALVDI